MIVFTCPLCQRRMQIDDTAAGQTVHCIGCGSPLCVPWPAVPTFIMPAVRQRPMVIEKTSKRLKKRLAFGYLLIALGLPGIPLYTVAVGNDWGTVQARAALGVASLAVMGIGLLWVLVMRAKIWWHHG